MKKFTIIILTVLLLTFSMNAGVAIAQQKSYSQGFYTMKDLNFFEDISYSVQNISQHDDGLLIILDSDKKIQQVVRLRPGAPKSPLRPFRSDYKFIIYGDVQLIFS